MNLVAKEYIACRGGDDGTVILSAFTGAAHTLRETLMVNPDDIDPVACMIDHALTLHCPERRARMLALNETVRDEHPREWALGFIDVILER
jgi:trehalose-6-phosphate synthase